MFAYKSYASDAKLPCTDSSMNVYPFAAWGGGFESACILGQVLAFLDSACFSGRAVLAFMNSARFPEQVLAFLDSARFLG